MRSDLGACAITRIPVSGFVIENCGLSLVSAKPVAVQSAFAVGDVEHIHLHHIDMSLTVHVKLDHPRLANP